MYLNTSDPAQCCGCGACASVCPRGCITMEADAEGFRYPRIDRERCVSCGLCERVCPCAQGETGSEEAQAWAGVYRDEAVARASASGGAFTALYDHLLGEGYAVFGVKFDENLRVVHDFGRTPAECAPFRTSKYVLSRSEHSYQQAADLLRAGEKVLYTGTPCQCAALRNFLKQRRVGDDGLIIADLVCHGAPNQQIFDSYIAELSRKTGDAVKGYRFRNKELMDGKINSRSARIDFESGAHRLVTSRTDPFLLGYYRRLFYRPSCASCRFAQIRRIGDVTIADAWGIEDIHPEWNSAQGVSLVLLNTPKGRALLPALMQRMDLKPVSLQWAEENNSQLHEPTRMHPKRDVFFRLWPRKGFYRAVQAAAGEKPVKRALRRIRRAIRRLLK